MKGPYLSVANQVMATPLAPLAAVELQLMACGSWTGPTPWLVEGGAYSLGLTMHMLPAILEGPWDG